MRSQKASTSASGSWHSPNHQRPQIPAVGACSILWVTPPLAGLLQGARPHPQHSRRILTASLGAPNTQAVPGGLAIPCPHLAHSGLGGGRGMNGLKSSSN